jgi:hypothetical protein
MESIIAALISAVASVIVAVISRNSPTSEKNTTPEGGGVRTEAAVTLTGKKQWMIALSILVPWLLLSPPLIQWDFAGLNVFVIMAVTLAISFAWPIKPLAAAAIVLILHPISFAMEPIAKGLRGMNPQGRLEPSKIIFLLSIFIGNAILAAVLCSWRRRARVPLSRVTKSVGFVEGRPPTFDSLSNELDKLGKLRAQGVISEEEFQRAKAKVLSG